LVVSDFEGLSKSPRQEMTRDYIREVVVAFADAALRRSRKLTPLCSLKLTRSPRDHFWGSHELWDIFFSGTRSVSAHSPVPAAL
jgi:hypothetical protein